MPIKYPGPGSGGAPGPPKKKKQQTSPSWTPSGQAAFPGPGQGGAPGPPMPQPPMPPPDMGMGGAAGWYGGAGQGAASQQAAPQAGGQNADGYYVNSEGYISTTPWRSSFYSGHSSEPFAQQPPAGGGGMGLPDLPYGPQGGGVHGKFGPLVPPQYPPMGGGGGGMPPPAYIPPSAYPITPGGAHILPPGTNPWDIPGARPSEGASGWIVPPGTKPWDIPGSVAGTHPIVPPGSVGTGPSSPLDADARNRALRDYIEQRRKELTDYITGGGDPYGADAPGWDRRAYLA